MIHNFKLSRCHLPFNYGFSRVSRYESLIMKDVARGMLACWGGISPLETFIAANS